MTLRDNDRYRRARVEASRQERHVRRVITEVAIVSISFSIVELLTDDIILSPMGPLRKHSETLF